MKHTRSYFILILIFCFSFWSAAQENTDFYQLTREACQSYPGDSPSNYISDLSHQYENPLSATGLGQMILTKSFGAAYRDYNYAYQEVLKEIIQLPEFKQALDECYKDKSLAKSYFVFFLHQMDLQGKTTSLSSEIFSLVGGSLLLAKFSKVVVQKVAWMERTFKWMGNVYLISVTAPLVLSVGEGVYKLVRQFNEGVTYELKDANEEKRKEAESLQDWGVDSVQRLEEKIAGLKIAIKSAQTEAKRDELQKLLKDSELLVKNLRSELNEIQEKLNSFEKK